VAESVSSSSQNVIDDCEVSGSGCNSDEDEDGKATDEGANVVDAATCTYCFSASTVMIGRIRKMVALMYLVEGDARVSGEETVPKPDKDEVSL
jgi:hypothetical protein